jgi:hypothetical protein
MQARPKRLRPLLLKMPVQRSRIRRGIHCCASFAVNMSASLPVKMLVDK